MQENWYVSLNRVHTEIKILSSSIDGLNEFDFNRFIYLNVCFQLAWLLRNGLIEEGESLRVVFEVQKHILDPISLTANNLGVRTRLLAIALVSYLPAAILSTMIVMAYPLNL